MSDITRFIAYQIMSAEIWYVPFQLDFKMLSFHEIYITVSFIKRIISSEI